MGRIESYILKRIEKEGAIHMTLIDPEVSSPENAALIASEAEENGSAAIMVGGSTIVWVQQLDDVVKAIKDAVKIPVILFPNNVTGISKYADAIWFMSLLNSSDPYFLMGAQVLGAPLVKMFGIEPLPMGYIIVGSGVTAGVIGRVNPIPYNKPRLAAAYALAAQCLGMHFIYLEAGSGAEKPVPVEMIREVKKTVDIPIIVGGGIRSGVQAKKAVEAGANIIVTGTVVEVASKVGEKIAEFTSSIKSVERRKSLTRKSN